MMMNDLLATSHGVPLAAGEPVGSSLLAAKVMMVDDEPLMTDLVQAYLEEAGYTNFVVTNDSRETLPLLRREAPGLLLLDLMMPQRSGFEVLEEIRADPELRFMPVIVLTASTGADVKLRVLQLGATDFLAKPVDESELVLRVRNTLAFHEYHNRVINFDAVTELPNERPFTRGLTQLLERQASKGDTVAIFSIEVPECRLLRESGAVDDAHQLARVIAGRLKRCISTGNDDDRAFFENEGRLVRAARLNEERFGLLIERPGSTDTLEATAERVLAALSATVVLGAYEITPTVWLGIAMSPGDGETAEALHKGADLAATHARQHGAAQFAFASLELNEKYYERLTLGSQLRGAAQRGELRLHYQPKVDLATGCIVGVEALVRWQHPDQGLIPPGRFIPLAEELGLITHIGTWVMEQACREVAAWTRAGLGEIKLSINVAKPQFKAGNLCSLLRQVLFDSGLSARQLVVELTESMLMDDVEVSLAQMREIKELGVLLSIDDFGTGYSSLSYLRRFPLDELKIDRSFLTDLPGQQNDVAIVRAVIELGHSLGMSVTAEGVEKIEQMNCLQQLRCDVYQGFLFSKPVPAEQLVKILEAVQEPLSAGEVQGRT